MPWTDIFPWAKLASRKYTDLIWKSSSKWAIYEPGTSQIKVGDYGIVDSKTGVFITEGNLFELEDYEDLLRKKPGTTANAALGNNSVAVKTAAAPGQTSESVKKIVSLNASQTAVSSSISANGQIAKAAFQGGWKFSNKTGAVLVVYRPRYLNLPDNLDVAKLAKHDQLRGKYLVTSLTTCDAYALCLTSKKGTQVSLALLVESTPAGADISASWLKDAGTGYFDYGDYDDKADKPYSVLYELKRCDQKVRALSRGSPTDENGLSGLADVSPPWKALDDEGNELIRRGYSG